MNFVNGAKVSQPRKRVLIGATGSVASVKIPIIVKTLLEEMSEQVEVKVVTTDAALHFFDRKTIPVEVLADRDEWSAWSKIPDPVMHIDLRNWADMIIICPLDANTLAKLAQGLCDNLLTCILRAWDERKPVIVCPAMNTNMWNHKFTAMHLSTLTDILGYQVIPPISKLLACGDLGIGAMADYRTIVNEIKKQVKLMSVPEETL
ncbi:flavoprotein [Gamsiella multidivaricata]|uniref:flavoprotein n=1 Tax=Gamsiella multidivaricata TaxID=101098 RepID=UPI00221EBB5A|nr:flavoprotein [Gamsiella multidivaricata]KAI7830320.1 flavoprotein [Gamsiella multidivaricata]